MRFYTPELYVEPHDDYDDDEGRLPYFGRRSDGYNLFYPFAVNVVFGPPESGKSLFAAAVVARHISDGGSALWCDFDYNGRGAVDRRLLDLGADPEFLFDPNHFRFVDDPDALEAVIDEAQDWKPRIVVIDSLGELMSICDGDPNSDRDYTRIHRDVLAQFANVAAVIAIDHEAKGIESRAYGASGSIAKKRAVDGALFRISLNKHFAPDAGGQATLTLVKDRHGALRALAPGEREPAIALFAMNPDGSWELHAPGDAAAQIADARIAALAAKLAAHDKAPTSVNEACSILRCRKQDAAKAFKLWQAQFPEPTGTTEPAARFPVPASIEAEPGTKPTPTQEGAHA